LSSLSQLVLCSLTLSLERRSLGLSRREVCSATDGVCGRLLRSGRRTYSPATTGKGGALDHRRSTSLGRSTLLGSSLSLPRSRERVLRGSSRASSRDCVSERERVGARKSKQKKSSRPVGLKFCLKLIHRICAPKKATLSLLLPQSTAPGAAPLAVHPPLCSKLY
jgi:hypothetical protein